MSSRTGADGWRDDLAVGEMDDCLLCSKATRSHAILLAYDPVADELRPTEDDVDAAVARGLVCHSCYERVDGDAELVVDDYEDWLREVCEENGTTLRALVDGDADADDLDDEDDSAEEDDVDPGEREYGIEVDADVPNYVLDGLPTHVLKATPSNAKLLRIEYEERYLDVEFEERDCDACGETADHRIETDHHRSRTETECSNCGETTTTIE